MLYLWTSRSSISNIFILNFRRLYSSWLINNVSTFGDMPLRNIGSVFSATILTFNVMWVISFRRRRQVCQISSFLLESLKLSHLFHSLLKLITLGFPFWNGCFIFLSHSRSHFWLCCLFYLVFFADCGNVPNFGAFTDFLVLSYSIRGECSSAFPTRD